LKPSRLSAGRRAEPGVLVTLAMFTAFSSAAVAQGNLAFLRQAPAAYLKEDDLKLMREAATAVLNSSESGVARTWENTATGNSGKIQRLSTFKTDDGRECQRLRIETRTKKAGPGVQTMNVCRASDSGEWLLDPDARPASSQG
jgi:surface antigen